MESGEEEWLLGKGVMPPDTEKKQSESNHPRDWDFCLWIHPFGRGLEGLELTFFFTQYTYQFPNDLGPKNHIYYKDTNGIRNRISLLRSGS